jgi:hypothetical protein
MVMTVTRSRTEKAEAHATSAHAAHSFELDGCGLDSDCLCQRQIALQVFLKSTWRRATNGTGGVTRKTVRSGQGHCQRFPGHYFLVH